MNSEQRVQFKNKMEEQIKNHLKRIKTNYFLLLSSLKFENIVHKKSEKDFDYKTIEESNASISEASQIKHIMDKELSYQDQLAIQNQGYAAYRQLIQSIKQLRQYNQYLQFSLIQNEPQLKSKNPSDLKTQYVD